MDKQRLFQLIERSSSTYSLSTTIFLASLIALVTLLVYLTGGIKFVYSHAMYIPIVVSGMVFGLRGGLIAGLAGGLALGPLMPIDTTTGEMQLAINWLYRTFFFTLIGAISGIGFTIFRQHISFLIWLQHHDPKTKLKNISSLIDYLKQAVKQKNQPHILAILSFTTLEEVSSTLGVQTSDDIIVELDNRLARSLPDGSTTFYPQANKLAAIIPIQNDEETPHVLSKINHSFTDNPPVYRNIPIYTDPYIGLININNIADEPEHIIRKAEIAANQSILHARPWTHFSKEHDSYTRENLELLGEMSDGIKCGEFELHYQPKIDLTSNVIHGAEALIRWNHKKRGYIPPSQFIPRVENSLLINSITDYVFDTSIKKLSEWRNSGFTDTIAINASTKNLTQNNFASNILRKLDQGSIDPQLMEIEITEGALMVDIENSIKKLNQLDAEGISISIDDFGTGFSSLQYLSRLPVSYLKIDQSFVFKLTQNESSKEIVASIINLAHTLGMKSVAEGIENEETLTLLRSMGCDIGQGYHFSKPLHPDNFDKWRDNYVSSLEQYPLI